MTYQIFNGRYDNFTRDGLKKALPEEDHVFINRYSVFDKPIVLDDSDNLIEKLADSIRPYHNCLSYAIAVLQDGARKIYVRPTNPCLGNLTKYHDGHLDFGKFNQTKPGDLYFDFPEGSVLGISIYRGKFDDYHRDLIEDSPVSEALSGIHSEFDKTARKQLFVQTRMDIDPNVFWIGLKWLNKSLNDTQYSKWGTFYKSLRQSFSSHETISILGYMNVLGYGKWASFSRLISKNPHRISQGKYSEGFGYTRSNCEYIFSSKKIKFGTDKFYNDPSKEETADEDLLFENVKKKLNIGPVIDQYGNPISYKTEDIRKMFDHLSEETEKRKGKE